MIRMTINFRPLQVGTSNKITSRWRRIRQVSYLVRQLEISINFRLKSQGISFVVEGIGNTCYQHVLSLSLSLSLR